MGRSRVQVGAISKTLKIVLTASQPVLVIISLGKGNALFIKKRINGIIQRAGCLIRYKGVRITDHYKCLDFDLS